jgi:hypothetical protein
MALMDKMKQQATQLAAKAQEATKAGQAKVEDFQSKRKSDDLLREIGAIVYADKTGKGGDPAKIEELVSQIAALEAEGATASAAPGAPAASDTTTTPEGGFKLD